MQVTISLLPTSLSLVHIPRSRLAQLSHPVLHYILQPTQTFLNMTCNEIEMSLFVEEGDLGEFTSIARRDRRHRRGSQAGSAGGSGQKEPVEISYEKWSVLQIDSHSDQLDNSGARINELSAPLAAAGISILYQSSYMSDFIFVKESRLQEALSLFSRAGFSLYSPQCSPTCPTPPAVLTRANSPDGVRPGTEPALRNKSHSPHAGQVHMLDTDLTCVGLADTAAEQWSLKIVKLVAFPELISVIKPSQRAPTPPSDSDDDSEDGYFSHSPSTESPISSTTSYSRSTSDLPSSLKPPSKHFLSALSPLRIDTTPLPPPPPPPVPFFSFTRTAEGSSLTTDVRILASLFPPNERHMVICGGELDFEDQAEPEEDEEDTSSKLRCLQIDLRRFGLDKHGLVNRFSKVLEQAGINHMYSSTVKTANLLVEKRHALRAQSLLRSC